MINLKNNNKRNINKKQNKGINKDILIALSKYTTVYGISTTAFKIILENKKYFLFGTLGVPYWIILLACGIPIVTPFTRLLVTIDNKTCGNTHNELGSKIKRFYIDKEDNYE